MGFDDRPNFWLARNSGASPKIADGGHEQISGGSMPLYFVIE
jgi:hypothetical protein